MSASEKLKIFKDKENKYYFKSKDNRHVDIEHKDRKLKFKLNKWDRESSVEVFLDMVEADTHTFIGNKIEVEDSNRTVTVYPIDIHDGGIKLKVVDKVKSPPYILRVPIVCENTRWSKQPPLTQEEKDVGYIRPENIINSFAIYHTTKKNNQYMTGKMFHWYQTKVIDVEGNWAWCDTDVDRYLDPTAVVITAPTEFMENAVYPVVWDPDLGYTAIGVSSQFIGSDSLSKSYRVGSAWTLPAGGPYVANYIRARIFGDAVADCTVLINQKDSGGAGTHGQIATKENLACGAVEHWEEFTLAGEVLTSAVVYIPNIQADWDIGIGQNYYIRFDNDGAVASYNENYPGQPYPHIENPWVAAAEGTTRDYSIFINYSSPSAGGGGAGAVVMGTKSLILDLLLTDMID